MAKTKLNKKQYEIEISKIRLFNTLYGIKFETQIFDEKLNEWTWNGKTLKDHINESRDGQIIKSARDTVNTEKVFVYGLVRRVSANGMNRQISLFAVNDRKEIVNITYNAHMILEGKEPPTNSFYEHVIKVNGTGMDMVFHTVYNLSSTLFEGIEGVGEEDREGYILNKRNL
tara:strand:- start:277 stop:792 length:516 start_codon:yes stop_codon:yes gene_type:complete